jgi:NADPH:quinone reductase-like Zn-dependent oxidoreductase
VIKGYMKDYVEHRFPLVPCIDLSGTVDAVGAEVDGFSVGDPVFGSHGKMVMGEGTLAEFATASAGSIARRPASLGEVEAAALPLAGVSALMSVDAANPQPGDLVVVVGAKGGIGSYAVQLAAARAARVIAVTSAGNVEYVESLGAGEALDRTAGDVLDTLKSRHPEGVSAIIDTASDAPALARLSEAVRDGGTVTSMKGAAAPDELEKRGIKGVNIRTEVTTERLAHLAGLTAAGKLKAPHIRTLTLDQAGEALDLIGQGGVRGKLVVTI